MRKKYIFSLVILGLLLLSTLLIGTGYGLWRSKQKTDTKIATDIECFKVYFSKEGDITFQNIIPVLENEGKKTSPYTITVTNICNATKTLDIRLNILKESTIKSDSLSINATGSINIDSIYYNDLKTAKSTQQDVSHSKLIGQIEISPNETIRTNIKLWFNELKNPIIKKEDYIKMRFELIDDQNAILPTLKENIFDYNKIVDKKPTYSEPPTTNEFLKIDNNYYFRGNVDNNYLLFANRLWRIIGINEDNTVKIILNDTLEPTSYSNYYNSTSYTSFRYPYYGDMVDNNINKYLLNWYQENLANYDQYIASSNYCNDTSRTVTNGQIYFGAYNRLNTNKEPTITCPNTEYDFGGIYNQKIGLITADEAAIAGAVYDQENTNYYLNNNTDFYTMSPSHFMYGYLSYVMYIEATGAIGSNSPTQELGIRPVITLKQEVTSEGNGTINNPFKIIME